METRISIIINNTNFNDIMISPTISLKKLVKGMLEIQPSNRYSLQQVYEILHQK